MTNRTHDAIAFASLITIALIYPPSSLNLMTLITSIIAADIGAMIPDMDQAGNKLWDLLPAGKAMGQIFKNIFYAHRTFSHSILGTYLIYKGLQFLIIRLLNPSFINPQIILTCIMIGYISHLLADAFTKDGLPLLFPFKIYFGIPPIKALRIKTGKFIETFFIFPSVWIYIFAVIYFNQDKLLKIINLIN